MFDRTKVLFNNGQSQTVIDYDLEVTRASCLGLGGIVQLWCRGKNLKDIFAKLLRSKSGKKLPEPETGDIQYGFLQGQEGIVDEVLIAWQDDYIELNCHGGTTSALAVLELLALNGFTEIDSRQWLQGELEVKKINRLELELNLMLPEAVTPLQLMILAQGQSLSKKIEEISRLLRQRQVEKVLPLLEKMLLNYDFASHVFKCHTVALVGGPNAGKSTTFNQLLLMDRALVTPHPGTTRDSVRQRIILAGLEVELVDTAGIMTTSEQVDAAAVERSKKWLQQADLRLLILDGSEVLKHEVKELLAYSCHFPTLVVINKDDLPRRLGREEGLDFAIDNAFSYSANNMAKIKQLEKIISAELWHLDVSKGQLEKLPEGGIPFTLRQRDLLQKSRLHLLSQKVGNALACLSQLFLP